jgi:hypothetical protein
MLVLSRTWVFDRPNIGPFSNENVGEWKCGEQERENRTLFMRAENSVLSPRASTNRSQLAVPSGVLKA